MGNPSSRDRDAPERQRRRRARVLAERSGGVPPAWAALRRTTPHRPAPAGTGIASAPAPVAPGGDRRRPPGPHPRPPGADPGAVSDWTRVRRIAAAIDRDLAADRMSAASAARAARDLAFVGREAELYVDVATASRAIERLAVVVVAALVKTVADPAERLACWTLIASAWVHADLDRDPY